MNDILNNDTACCVINWLKSNDYFIVHGASAYVVRVDLTAAVCNCHLIY